MRLKIWLSLGLAVLLVHLALMESLPLGLPLTPPEATATFATRTVLRPNELTLAPAKTTPARPARPESKPKSPAPQPRPAPATPAPAEASAPLATENTSPSAMEAVTGSAPESKASTAAPVAEQASATPESAPAPDTSPAAKEATLSADALPGSVKLVYRVEANKFPFTLRSELLWQQVDESYQARLSFSAFGQSRVQTSRGLIDAYGLAPERFSDKYRSEVAAHFNRAQRVVSFSANTPNLPLQPGAQDRLSVLVQLAALVANAPTRFTPGTTLSMQTIGPRDGDQWLFTFGEMEALELPGGPQQGLKLVRQPRQTYDQKVEIWLAPGLSYLPARIRITEANGDYLDQKWAASETADSP